MTQSSQPRDNVYLSISFTNIPREKAEAAVRAVEGVVGDNDFSVDYGDPIGDASPTPVADEAAQAVGGDPTSENPSDPDVQPGVGDSLPPVQEPQQPASSDSTSVVTGEQSSPVADEGSDLPVQSTPVTPSDAPLDAEPADAGTAPDAAPAEPVDTPETDPTATDGAS